MTQSPIETKGHLLIVSYDFPPIVSAGVYRVVAFANRLRRKGWRITVLTATRSPYETTDEATQAMVDPGIEVARATPLDPPWANPPARRAPPHPRTLQWVRHKTTSALRLLHTKVFGIPDPKATWSLPLIWRAWRMLRRGPVVVLSSSPPHSSQFALAVLRRLVAFRWIADFRDPWTAPNRHHKRGLRLKLERRMESSVLRSCDRILANTPGNRRALLEAYQFLPGEKVEVVTNGYDETAKSNQPPLDYEVERYDMLYFGEVYPGMLDLLLDALDNLVQKKSPFIPHIAVHGWITNGDRDKIRRRGHERRIEFRGTLSYKRSIGVMSQAKSLLLLLWHDPHHENCVPSKLYPYLAAGPPIVAIAPRGDATEVLENTGAGVSIVEADPMAVALRLEEVVAAIRDGSIRTERREDRIRQYSLDSLVDRIDGILTDEAKSW